MTCTMICTMIQQPSKLRGRTTRGTMDTWQNTCSKTRVKLQNIAYKSSKIVCGWSFTPPPSHHLVSCIYPHHSHDSYLMSNVPFLNNAKIAYGPETWLHHTLLPPSYLHYRPMVSTPVYYNFDALSYAATRLQV